MASFFNLTRPKIRKNLKFIAGFPYKKRDRLFGLNTIFVECRASIRVSHGSDLTQFFLIDTWINSSFCFRSVKNKGKLISRWQKHLKKFHSNIDFSKFQKDGLRSLWELFTGDFVGAMRTPASGLWTTLRTTSVCPIFVLMCSLPVSASIPIQRISNPWANHPQISDLFFQMSMLSVVFRHDLLPEESKPVEIVNGVYSSNKLRVCGEITPWWPRRASPKLSVVFLATPLVGLL